MKDKVAAVAMMILVGFVCYVSGRAIGEKQSAQELADAHVELIQASETVNNSIEAVRKCQTMLDSMMHPTIVDQGEI